jgi:hypothetical protein
MTETNNPKNRFLKLDQARSTHLNRARLCSKLTLPHLLPPEGADSNTPLSTPYQGLGSRAVNNLASKLLLALLPPNSPFFRLRIEEAVLNELKQTLGKDDLKTQVEDKLASIERQVSEFVETTAMRVSAFRAFRLLISTGNALCYLPKDGGMRVFRLDQYVVKRDPMGNLLEAIIREEVSPKALPQVIIEGLGDKINDEAKNEMIEMFTEIRREEENKYLVDQFIAGESLSQYNPDIKGEYKEDEVPFIALRWNASEGEDYGRGHVEEYLGDFISLESLSRSLVEGAAAASKVIFMVSPNGTTDEQDLIDCPNAGFAQGNRDDVSVLQMDKFHDFSLAASTAQNIESRLAEAFLLHSSIQRDAERVTAEEIRYMAQELEDSLGGIYSVLSIEFQLPLVKRVMKVMNTAKKLEKLPTEVKPVITTGLEALGRGHDLNKLMAFADIAERFARIQSPYLNQEDALNRAATALGIDTGGLVFTQEQVQEAQTQQKQEAMGAEMAPKVAQEVAKAMAQQNMNQ